MNASSGSVLQAEGLRVRLGGTEVLRGVNLDVRRGDLYGLLGRNGAGKTTSLRCALGLLPSYGGRCSVFGVAATRLARVVEPVGIALDPHGLDDTLSVRQNLELAAIRGGIRGGRGVDEVLRLVGLTHRAGHRGDRLSHGQGRRAAVARALLGAPQLLVLDEPLSGLDPEGVETMIALFRRLALEEGVTVVLSSHHLREMEEVCTRVGILEDGRTVLEGETAALLAQGGQWLRVHCRAAEAAAAVLAGESGVRAVTALGGGWLRARIAADLPLEGVLQRLAAAPLGLDEFHRERVSLVDLFREALARHKAAEAA